MSKLYMSSFEWEREKHRKKIRNNWIILCLGIALGYLIKSIEGWIL